jgi:hypothetical protein
MWKIISCWNGSCHLLYCAYQLDHCPHSKILLLLTGTDKSFSTYSSFSFLMDLLFDGDGWAQYGCTGEHSLYLHPHLPTLKTIVNYLIFMHEKHKYFDRNILIYCRFRKRKLKNVEMVRSRFVESLIDSPFSSKICFSSIRVLLKKWIIPFYSTYIFLCKITDY